MDAAFLAELLEHLGPRYRAGASGPEGVELLFRAGRGEYRPCRVVLGGESGQALTLLVDVRIPKGASVEEAERLVVAFERGSAAPRGLSRAGDSTSPMHAESGQESGLVRSLRYVRQAGPAAEAARHVRALVESVDIPIVVGIHEPEHLAAVDPPPPRPKVARAGALDPWEYSVRSGLLGSLVLLIDPNHRTLSVRQRRLLSTQTLVDGLRLAQLRCFRLRRQGRALLLLGVKRSGEEQPLLTTPEEAEVLATLGRMSDKLRIPLEGP